MTLLDKPIYNKLSSPEKNQRVDAIIQSQISKGKLKNAQMLINLFYDRDMTTVAKAYKRLKIIARMEGIA